MPKQFRSVVSRHGRLMAGARSLWKANGMTDEQMNQPLIAIANSFTQFVPGHVHLHDVGQRIKKRIQKTGCFAAEFNTIAIDDGIAMGHSGMLYSLPSREIIADSVEYMVNAHCADALICVSNCDKITPGMLMAALHLNIPTVFVSGGPMEAGHSDEKSLDLIDAMIMAGDESVDDEELNRMENLACPTCGSCSGMFTANSMNCLVEALGLGLPGNGTVLATHSERAGLFDRAADLIGGLAVLFGNLAMDGAVVKTAGVDNCILTFSGTVRVFDSQEATVKAILGGEIVAGDVLIIRYEGPRGGPGMQEMLYPTSYLKSMKLGQVCALITDGRFSGGTSGLSIGHVSPEAASGGAIGLVHNGDIVDIDIPGRKINVRLTGVELQNRRDEEEAKGALAWKPQRKRDVPDSLRAYAFFATSADKGAVRVIPED